MNVCSVLPGTQLNAASLPHTNFPTLVSMLKGWRTLSVCLLLVLQGCSSGWARLNHSAQRAGVMSHEVSGIGFTHTVFVKAATGATGQSTTVSLPVVFIEGDGMPWRSHGWQPNPDPRPDHALAFNLFLQTPDAWYITRPCYDASLTSPACSTMVWTDARYSPANVASMVAALRRFAAEQQVQKFWLVGYSGGGVLAVLIAAQMHEVAGVVTIAANLDQAAWVEAHQYSPLEGSLNPATDTPDLAVPHVAMHGRRDDNVPVQTLVRFIDSHPSSQWRYLEQYDHVCCWERDWPKLWPEIQHTLESK